MSALLALCLYFTPLLHAADLDGDGYDSTVDCDDNDASVHPEQQERCESGSEQIDNDCNGDVNSADGFNTLINPQISLYVDEDSDNYGDPDVGTVAACALVDGYANNNQDCDDTDDTIYPGAEEVCDLIDQDCDGLVDEPDLDPETSGCVDLYLDSDGDGYGNTDRSECLCLYGDRTSTDVSGETYVLAGGDCYDYDATIKPLSCSDGFDNDGDGDIDDSDADCAAGYDEHGTAVEEKHELLDGHDNDCDGWIPAIELDCDDDGASPTIPAEELRYGSTYQTHADVGLSTCGTVEATETLTCWSQDITLRCDRQVIDSSSGEVTGSGLWMLSYTDSPDAFGGRYTNGHREYIEPRTMGTGDCDDHCAARGAHLPEACDGVDNDCSGVDSSVESDGLPGALTDGLAGTVSAAEADLDGDGALDCDQFSTGATQDEAAPATCGGSYETTDCDDLDSTATDSGDCLASDTGSAGDGEDKGGKEGCGGSAAWLLLPLLPLMIRRRSRH